MRQNIDPDFSMILPLLHDERLFMQYQLGTIHFGALLLNSSSRQAPCALHMHVPLYVRMTRISWGPKAACHRRGTKTCIFTSTSNKLLIALVIPQITKDRQRHDFKVGLETM